MLFVVVVVFFFFHSHGTPGAVPAPHTVTLQQNRGLNAGSPAPPPRSDLSWAPVAGCGALGVPGTRLQVAGTDWDALRPVGTGKDRLGCAGTLGPAGTGWDWLGPWDQLGLLGLLGTGWDREGPSRGPWDFVEPGLTFTMHFFKLYF